MRHKISQWKTILWEFVFSRGIKLLNTREYDRRVFVYQFALVHLAALLNETNLSKRKRKNTVEFLLYISEVILLFLSVNNLVFFFFFLSLLSLYKSHLSPSSLRNINSHKNTQGLSVKFSIDFASKFAKMEPHKIEEFEKL